MTQAFALIWKEWREVRWFLVFGLVVFNLFPLLEALDRWRQGWFYSDMGEGMVLGLGGLFAVIVAVAVTCRDLRGGMNTFWLSRPITVNRFLATKYGMGLLVVLAVTVVTLLAQMLMYAMREMSTLPHMSMQFVLWHPLALFGALLGWSPFTGSVLICHTPTLLLIYSVAFLIGALVRRAVPATLLSIAAGLLVYFLPILIPPLGFASVVNVLVDSNMTNSGLPANYQPFVMATLLGCVIAVVAALVAVRREWRLRADLRLLCWTLGGVVLLLLATSAFQLRSNLDCEQRISLKALGESTPQNRKQFGEYGMEPYGVFIKNDDRGILAFQNFGRGLDRPTSLATFDLSKPSAGLRTIVPSSENIVLNGPPPTVSSPDRPDRVYVLLDEGRYDTAPGGAWYWHRKWTTLLTVATDKPESQAVLHRLDLTVALASCREFSRLAMLRDKLYAVALNKDGATWNLTVIDARNPDVPSIDKASEAAQAGFRTFVGNVTRGQPFDRARALDFAWVAVPGMPIRDRVELSVQLTLSSWTDRQLALDGDLLVRADHDGLTTYRLVIKNDTAEFQEVGFLKPPPLFSMRGTPSSLIVRDGRACTIDPSLSDMVTVYDVSRPERPRRLGHYAVANHRFHDLAFLPDHRLLVVGDELNILGMP